MTDPQLDRREIMGVRTNRASTALTASPRPTRSGNSVDDSQNNERRGTFRLAGKRYSYRASMIPPDSEKAGRWQINVHGGSMLPVAFKVAPTFEQALADAKDHLRGKVGMERMIFERGDVVVGNYSQSRLRLTEPAPSDATGEPGWNCEYVSSGARDWVSEYQLGFFTRLATQEGEDG